MIHCNFFNFFRRVWNLSSCFKSTVYVESWSGGSKEGKVQWWLYLVKSLDLSPFCPLVPTQRWQCKRKTLSAKTVSNWLISMTKHMTSVSVWTQIYIFWSGHILRDRPSWYLTPISNFGFKDWSSWCTRSSISSTEEVQKNID
jgi:hypothetical protein